MKKMFDQIEPMTPEEAAAVEAKLDAYDRAAVPPVSGAEAEEIVLKIEDGGRIVAGCAAYVDDWKCMDLSCLWVDGRYRNRGMGTQLFSEMLRAGKAIGCHLAAVGLYSFQASAFCEKRGMTVYDRKEDCPRDTPTNIFSYVSTGTNRSGRRKGSRTESSAAATKTVRFLWNGSTRTATVRSPAGTKGCRSTERSLTARAS